MLPRKSATGYVRLSLLAASLAAAACMLASVPADAHFVLKTPAAVMSQTTLGDPQKMPPCGDDGSGTPSGMVTSFAPGDTIEITIDETITHPGHYRIALGVNGPGDLPAEPTVTPGANTPCGTAEVMNPPVFPVLADNVFEHTASFGAPQTIKVTLPDNVTCDNCTLQIIEFMSEHPLNNPGGCFYHHCANISITPGGGTTGSGTGTGGTGGSAGAGMGGGGTAGSAGAMTGGGGSPDGGAAGAGLAEQPPSTSGCSCSIPGGDSAPPFVALGIGLGLAALRRRRKAAR